MFYIIISPYNRQGAKEKLLIFYQFIHRFSPKKFAQLGKNIFYVVIYTTVLSAHCIMST